MPTDVIELVVPFISIHALRVEGDILLHYYTREIAYISIHALRVEGDRAYHGVCQLGQNFYPRPPGGGRHHAEVQYAV